MKQKRRFKTAPAIFVKYKGVVYLTNAYTKRPKKSKILKNKFGQIYGIPVFTDLAIPLFLENTKRC